MAISEGDRVLRMICILTWIPAFSVLLPHGIIAHSVVPALGIVPMSLSTLIASIYIANYRINRKAGVFLDLFIGAFLLGIMIAGWILIKFGCCGWRTRAGGTRMLGTFGTAIMTLNFCIHLYFVIQETSILTWLGQLFGSPTCPHCNRDLRLLWDLSRAHSEHSGDSKEYVSIPGQDNEDEGHASVQGSKTKH